MLGVLAWYQVSSGTSDAPLDTSHDQLTAWFRELDLNRDFLPLPPKGVDCFRTACGSIVDTYETVTERVKLSVQEQSRTTGQVTRHVVRTGTDLRSGKVTSARVAEVVFLRPRRTSAGRIHGTEAVEWMIHPGLSQVDKVHVEAAIARFERRYSELKDYVTPASLRYVIRNYLIYIDAIPIPSANLWFAPEDRSDVLRTLQDLVRRCGSRCTFHIAPLVDDDEQRDMLAECVESELVDQARTLQGLIHRWGEDNPGRQMPVLRFAGFRMEYRGVKARHEEYLARLGRDLPLSGEALSNVLSELKQIPLAQEV